MAENKMNYRMGSGYGMYAANSRMNRGGNRSYNNVRSGSSRSDCGCKNNTNRSNTSRSNVNRSGEGDSCCEAMEKLRKLEFSIVDVALYLNAYPDSDCALAYYHKLLEERNCLLHKVHEECGPTTIYDNHSETCWKWVEGPWPWHIDAN